MSTNEKSDFSPPIAAPIITPSEEPHPGTGRLRHNSMSVGHVVFFVVAAAAPLTVVVALFPVIIGVGDGIGVAGAFLTVAIVLAIFAVGYTTMSRYIVNAGDFYAYVTEGLGRPPGLGAASLAVFAYTSIQLGLYGAIGFFARQLFEQYLHVSLPWWCYAFAAMAICLVLGVRRIDLGAKIMGVLLGVETISVMILDIAIVSSGGATGHLSWQSFTPAATFGGAVGVAVMFAHASFVGFEGTAIYGEESRDPTRTVPRATYISVAFLGIFYALSAWLVVNAYHSSDVVAAAQRDPGGFILNISTQYVGRDLTDVMSVLIVTSMFAAIVAFHNNVSRYFFALGRRRVIWHRLGATHPTRQSPYVACVLQTVLAGVVVALFAIFRGDPYNQLFTWLTGIGAVGVIMLQTAAAIAVFVFFRRRNVDKRIWHTVIAPVLAVVGLLTLLYFAFTNFTTLVGAQGPVATTLLVLLIGTPVTAAGIALWLRRSVPDTYQRIGGMVRADLE